MKHLLTSILLLIGLSCFSQNRYRNTALDTAAKQVGLGPVNISNLNVSYPGTSIIYLKFYDSYTQVYSRTSTPVYTVMLQSDVVANSIAVYPESGMRFKNGCWVKACTSIADTATVGVQPAIKPLIEITY